MNAIHGHCEVTPYNTETHLCDSRNSTIYPFVTIGDQVWMAKNLNYDVPSDTIDRCYDNCTIYGRLYNWATAMTNSASSNANPSRVRGVCPSGWHLPSHAEWTTLTSYVETNGGCTKCAGTKLKAKSGWNKNGTDDFGFSALPGGYADLDSVGIFRNSGSYGFWLSSTEHTTTANAYRSYMHNDSSNVVINGGSKKRLYSVRCVKDSP